MYCILVIFLSDCFSFCTILSSGFSYRLVIMRLNRLAESASEESGVGGN